MVVNWKKMKVETHCTVNCWSIEKKWTWKQISWKLFWRLKSKSQNRYCEIWWSIEKWKLKQISWKLPANWNKSLVRAKKWTGGPRSRTKWLNSLIQQQQQTTQPILLNYFSWLPSQQINMWCVIWWYAVPEWHPAIINLVILLLIYLCSMCVTYDWNTQCMPHGTEVW